jgi:hypothetical protein
VVIIQPPILNLTCRNEPQLACAATPANHASHYYNLAIVPSVIRASVEEWGLSRTKVCSGAVDVLRVAISGSRQGVGRRRDLR